MYYNGSQNDNMNNQGYAPQNPQGYTPQNMGTQPIRGWCWGAFMYNWIWGIAHKCYLPLICLIPGLGFIWLFVCGAKGHEWAMNSGMFRTVEEYNASMTTWNRAGKFAFIFYIIFFILYFIIFFGIFGMALFSAGLNS